MCKFESGLTNKKCKLFLGRVNALRRSQLKSELLEEMLKLSEEYTGVDLRKKFGAKR